MSDLIGNPEDWVSHVGGSYFVLSDPGGFVLYALNTSDNSDSLVTDDSSSIGSKKQL